MVMEIRSAKKEDIGNILKVIGSDRFGNKWDKPLAKRKKEKGTVLFSGIENLK
jgi:hypothetical protein